jgi:hypothetical protein
LKFASPLSERFVRDIIRAQNKLIIPDNVVKLPDVRISLFLIVPIRVRGEQLFPANNPSSLWRDGQVGVRVDIPTLASRSRRRKASALFHLFFFSFVADDFSRPKAGSAKGGVHIKKVYL